MELIFGVCYISLNFFITGPPNGPVLCCSLASVLCCRRLSLSSVMLPAGGAGRPSGAWAVGRPSLPSGQYGYVPLGRHLVFVSSFLSSPQVV